MLNQLRRTTAIFFDWHCELDWNFRCGGFCWNGWGAIIKCTQNIRIHTPIDYWICQHMWRYAMCISLCIFSRRCFGPSNANAIQHRKTQSTSFAWVHFFSTPVRHNQNHHSAQTHAFMHIHVAFKSFKMNQQRKHSLCTSTSSMHTHTHTNGTFLRALALPLSYTITI